MNQLNTIHMFQCRSIGVQAQEEKDQTTNKFGVMCSPEKQVVARQEQSYDDDGDQHKS